MTEELTLSDAPVPESTYPMTLSMIPVAPPPPIKLADILAATEVIQQKEAQDKIVLDSIAAQSFESLRTKLIQWGVAGFPNVYSILSVSVVPPPVCSDGVSRSLADYIAFCSGKTIGEHVALLQEKLDDIVVSYANMGESIAIVVSKA